VITEILNVSLLGFLEIGKAIAASYKPTVAIAPYRNTRLRNRLLRRVRDRASRGAGAAGTRHAGRT